MNANLKSMTMAEIGGVLKELGQPAFRAKQVFTWLHKGVRSYDEMSNLPQNLRAELASRYPIYAPEVVRKQESQKDGTIKYLWRLSDGNCVETVLMRYHYGNTVCISSEVGCLMGCAFCASTLGGLVRRLEPHEMLDQVLFTQIDSVKIRGEVEAEKIERLGKPMVIDGYETKPVEIGIVTRKQDFTVLSMKLYEGRNRQIRKMCEQLELHVMALKRISIGDVKLGNLPIGAWRHLTRAQVESLKN